jgi:hypothetical protein
MIGSNDLLLGFDAREMWLGPREDRPEGDQSCFFLRQDAIKQLSVDIMIWASVFQVDQVLTRPQWTGPIQSLWNNLQTLQTYLYQCEAKPYWIIAVTLCSDLCEGEELETWKLRAATIQPALPDEAWDLLGYDVADEWLLSVLTNCGFDKLTEDVEAIRKKYVPALNAYHLFDALEPATEFRMLSDERVQEHAPFFVFGIWLIKKEGGLGDQTD